VARLPAALDAHFRQPWRTPAAPREARAGVGENPACGDRLALELAPAPAGGLEVRMGVRGCSAVIALASAAASALSGQSLERAAGLDVAELARALGGLAPTQQHAVAVVSRALAGALQHARAAAAGAGSETGLGRPSEPGLG
jgi:NifU-like protein involved in Fe-S cluster formation